MRPPPVDLRSIPARIGPRDLRAHWGPPVGVDRVLAGADRQGCPCDVPGPAAVAGFAWGEHESTDERWWPQGITALAPGAESQGRTRLAVSWYAERHTATRVTLVDRADGPDPVYRHVDLVVPDRDPRGRPRLRPVRAHAGGLARSGSYLFVAATRFGIRVFDLDAFLATPSGYALPQVLALRATWRWRTDAMRFSFLDLAGDGDLVSGEYGRSGGRHLLARYAVEPSTGLLRAGEDGSIRPLRVYDQAEAERMQGAAVVDGTWFVTTSQGRGRAGDLWTGVPGDLRRHRGVLPPGPEDLTYDRRSGRLWSLTEWPAHRWVYALDPGAWRA